MLRLKLHSKLYRYCSECGHQIDESTSMCQGGLCDTCYRFGSSSSNDDKKWF